MACWPSALASGCGVARRAPALSGRTSSSCASDANSDECWATSASARSESQRWILLRVDEKRGTG
eukprot:1276147-Prymnesium_polylepis.1